MRREIDLGKKDPHRAYSNVNPVVARKLSTFSSLTADVFASAVGTLGILILGILKEDRFIRLKGKRR